MSRFGLEILSVFGLPPVEHVQLAADLGCPYVSMAVGPVPWTRFAPWSLRTDAALRRQMKAAMRHRGVAISIAEGFAITPQADIAERAADLDVAAELDAPLASTVIMDADRGRALDQLARLAEMAGERGMGVALEFAPPNPVGDLDAALATLREVDKPNLRLVIDSMHFFRSGGRVEQLAALDPALVGHVQLSDVPLAPAQADYLQEACFARRIPGEGELPLREFVAALPPATPLGLEIPMLAELEDGAELGELMRRAVEAARHLLDAGPAR